MSCKTIKLKEIANIERVKKDKFSRYVGTNINIQVDTLNNFELQYDDDLEKQKLFSDMLSLIIEMEQQEQQIIDDLKDSKQYYLTNMFI